MSANQCSTTHIRALVSAAMRWDTYNTVPRPPVAMMERHPEAFKHLLRAGPSPLNSNWVKTYPDEFGRALVLANLDSLNARYPAHADPESDAAWVADFRHAHTDHEPLAMIKNADYFAYQSCEVSDWESCWANAAYKALRECAISAATSREPWGIADPAGGPLEPGKAGAPVSLLALSRKA